MAVMEALMMFYLADKLTPLMWAKHNIQYLNKLLLRELFRQTETESLETARNHDFNELAKMSKQLHHTFFDISKLGRH